MARAKINLTCSDCGESFEHIKFCNNRRDADSYEAWARENVTQCPTCYRKAQLARKLEGLDLPEITGVSDKQIAYARKLRDRWAAEHRLTVIEIPPVVAQYLEQMEDPEIAYRVQENAGGLTGKDAVLAVLDPHERKSYIVATSGDAHTLIEALTK